MVLFQCEDCGESVTKGKLPRHMRFCSATKFSCINCGNIFGQDSAPYHKHIQCIAESDKYSPNDENSKQELDFDVNAELYNIPSWFCSLCDANMTSEQDYFSHITYGKKHRELADKQKQHCDFGINEYSEQQPDSDIYVGLSNCYPWFCSLCNSKTTSQKSLISHARGKKHRANVKQQQQQLEHSIVDNKDNSKQQPQVNINTGLSDRHPWFCSLCNTEATSHHSLLSHANGKQHRGNVEWFDANGYSQADKKRKLETSDETWNREVVHAEEEAKGGSEEKGESKKAKKQEHEKKEKKQTKLDSNFEYEKEDIKLLLVSYSKEELVNLVYKTAEKGSRLISTILESADRDIAQRNIFVRGFGWDTTHENLKAAFESYGEIEECSVVMDNNTGRSKGYGFVLFKTRKGARKALRNPEKRLYNRILVCNLALKKSCEAGKAHDMVEPVKIDLTKMPNQSEVVFLPRLELAHGHVPEKRHHQQTMDMFGQNMPFYGHSQLSGFDPMYGAVSGNQMVAGPPNYCMFGSGMMNQGPMLPPNHMGMAGQYFGDGEHAWYQR
ncbi:UBP1-associated proteins 1C [Cardamine amara subsp. amara]|uniref:UBP1-associated proteins 1C n=1 Tax=Cardamine amara subsp. amara TaxID=228776 RepID=A0ABD1BMH3_CARAN